MYPHTLLFCDTLCLKNALYTFFLKLLFFSSLLLLLTPETLPNHLFRQTNHKNYLKSSLKEKKNFLFSYNLFHIFPLPLRKKTKPLTFFPLFIIGIRKTARENVLLKNFFFFLTFSTLPLLLIGKITTYLFYSKFRLKVP